MKKYTLQKKITKTFIWLFCLILLVVIVLITAISSRVYWNKSFQLCEQLVNLNLNLLNDQITEIQQTQEYIAKNEVTKEAALHYSEHGEKNYSLELQYQRMLDDVFNLFSKNIEVRGAYIVDTEGNYFYFYKESLKINHNMLNEEWYQSLTEEINMDTCYVSGYHDRTYLVNETDEQCVSMVMPIQGSEGYRFRADAFLVCDIGIDSILNSGNSKDDMQFAILDNKDELYSSTPLNLSVDEKEKIIRSVNKENTSVEILSRNLLNCSIVVSMQSQMFGWKVIGVKNLQEITDLIFSLFVIFCIAMIVVMALVSFLSNRVSRSILLPMNYLIDECNQVAAGNYHVKFEEKKSEEISFLSDTIQEMVNNVVELTNQVIQEEKMVSEEKLRALQHQINPHFLNNVLQTIKALAVAEETEKVSKMATLLGRILAYSVYEPYENVELNTELNYLHNYIELQNIRFENNILHNIDCEEDAQTVQIPKLTLQPLVENAIEHGAKGKHKIIINVSAEVEPDMVCVIINDNGTGIGREELETLKERLENGEVYQQKSSVGIVNVNERLKRTFGLQYGVQIFSPNDGGTTVVVRVPKRKED